MWMCQLILHAVACTNFTRRWMSRFEYLLRELVNSPDTQYGVMHTFSVSYTRYSQQSSSIGSPIAFVMLLPVLQERCALAPELSNAPQHTRAWVLREIAPISSINYHTSHQQGSQVKAIVHAVQPHESWQLVHVPGMGGLVVEEPDTHDSKRVDVCFVSQAFDFHETALGRHKRNTSNAGNSFRGRVREAETGHDYAGQAAALRSWKAQEDIVGFDVLMHDRFLLISAVRDSFISVSFSVNEAIVKECQGFRDRDDHMESEERRHPPVIALLKEISATAMLEQHLGISTGRIEIATEQANDVGMELRQVA